jgi:hypothetical protein
MAPFLAVIFIISWFFLVALFRILREKEEEYFFEEEEEYFFPEEDEAFFIEEEEELIIEDFFLGFLLPEEFHSIMLMIDFYLSALLSFFVVIN